MNTQNKVELYKIRSVGGMLTDTVSLVKNNFKTLFSGLFYISSPALLVSIVCFILFFKGYIDKLFYSASVHFEDSLSDEMFFYEIVTLLPYLIIMVLGVFLASVLVIVVSFSFVKLYKNEEEITVRSLWNSSKKYILKIIGAQLLFALVIVLFYIICFLPLLFVFLGVDSIMFKVLIPILLLILFFIISFYVFVKITFYQHFLIVEDKGIIESFKMSYNFSKNIFWKVFGAVFLLTILVSICGNFFQMPGFIVMYVGMILGFVNQEDYSLIMLLGTALMSIGMMFSYLFYSVIYIGISVTYYSVMEERFGIKAAEEIDAIGKNDDI